MEGKNRGRSWGKAEGKAWEKRGSGGPATHPQREVQCEAEAAKVDEGEGEAFRGDEVLDMVYGTNEDGEP